MWLRKSGKISGKKSGKKWAGRVNAGRGNGERIVGSIS
jgi:hypothetical protein